MPFYYKIVTDCRDDDVMVKKEFILCTPTPLIDSQTSGHFWKINPETGQTFEDKPRDGESVYFNVIQEISLSELMQIYYPLWQKVWTEVQTELTDFNKFFFAPFSE